MWRKEEGKARPGSDSASGPDFTNTPESVRHGIRIKGEITGQGDFFLDGEVEGKISIGNGTLTIGPNSRVHAEIEARNVEIRGEVIGALRACERVHIYSTGRLTGPMETRGIVIEDGAILHSKVATPEPGARKIDAFASSASKNESLPEPEPSQRAIGSGA